jgi:hypothetical protein
MYRADLIKVTFDRDRGSVTLETARMTRQGKECWSETFGTSSIQVFSQLEKVVSFLRLNAKFSILVRLVSNLRLDGSKAI